MTSSTMKQNNTTASVDGVISSKTTPSAKKQLNKKRFIGILVVIAAVAISLTVIFSLFINSNSLSNEEVVSKVSTLVADLPAESPTVATIENIEELSRRDGFYSGAENGDKLLVYGSSNRAIIYSVNEDRVVKDGVVSVQQ